MKAKRDQEGGNITTHTYPRSLKYGETEAYVEIRQLRLSASLLSTLGSNVDARKPLPLLEAYLGTMTQLRVLVALPGSDLHPF